MQTGYLAVSQAGLVQEVLYVDISTFFPHQPCLLGSEFHHFPEALVDDAAVARVRPRMAASPA